jgi:hypothetical protein
MKQALSRWAVIGLIALAPAAPAQSVVTQPDLEKLGASIAEQLAKACPQAAYDDTDAHAKCAAALRTANFIPYSPDGLLWGGEQPSLRLSKWQLTHLNPIIWQLNYLSLFTFTGHWSVSTDGKERVNVIHLEAYFRNALPPDEFPYPFWHSAAKWNAYQTANELKLFLDRNGRVFVATRSQAGSDADRGAYASVTPPAFDGNWMWTDPSGHLQPHVSLFANRYSADNPYLPMLDKTYRAFAMQVRSGTCLDCHTPENKATMDHLVLLQTPVHASGEIDAVLAEVRTGKMPQDDLGLRKDISPALRAAIIRTGEDFRIALRGADRWEAIHSH